MKRLLYIFLVLTSIFVESSLGKQNYKREDDFSYKRRRHIAICAEFFRQHPRDVSRYMCDIWPLSSSDVRGARLNLAAQAGNYRIFTTILNRQEKGDLKNRYIKEASQFALGVSSYTLAKDLPVDVVGRRAIISSLMKASIDKKP